MIPPKLVSTAASVKNWARILFFLAPIAFLRPISLVRSVTDTSIIFITPIPPTNKEILAIQINCLFVVALTCWLSSAVSFILAARYLILLLVTVSFNKVCAAFPTDVILSVESASSFAFCGSSYCCTIFQSTSGITTIPLALPSLYT